MSQLSTVGSRVRIGEFEIDLDSGEFVDNGARVRLQVQSLALLKALLERPGLIVEREELRQRLWPSDTFVDFDHGLNAAVRRLREAFGDSAETPRFVETIPRKGYRLVAPTEPVAAAVAPVPQAAPEPVQSTLSPTARRPLSRRSPRWAYMPAGMLVLSTVAAGAWLARTPTPVHGRPSPVAFPLDVPAGWTLGAFDQLALSPDGRYLVFTAAGPDGRRSLWLRPLAGHPRQIPGSDGAMSAFWSPDSASIAFFADGALKAVPLATGTAQVLTRVAPAPLTGGVGAWRLGGDILFMPLGSSFGTPVHPAGLRRLVSATGAVRPLASATEPREYLDHLAPSAIPGADAFTFVRWNPSTLTMTGHVTDASGSRVTDLGAIDSRVVVTASHHAVFVRDGVLVAQPINIARGSFVGAPFPLAQDIAVSQPLLGHFSASADAIVYLTKSAIAVGGRLTLVTRGGSPIRTLTDAADFSGVRVSPDGTRLVLARRDPIAGTRDIWVQDVTATAQTRLTFDRRDDMAPAWSTDGKNILFTSDRSGKRDLYRKEVTGGRPEVPAVASKDSKSLNAWSPDGRLAIFDTGARAAIDSQGRINKDLFVLSLDGPGRVQPLAATDASESNADIAPDGTLVAYQSSEKGRTEIIVETFPEKGGRWQVTSSGAAEPAWRADGRELFFVSSRDELCAVTVDRVGENVRFGHPRVLFRVENPTHQSRRYAPFPDGQRFIVLSEAAQAEQRIMFLVNWQSVLPE